MRREGDFNVDYDEWLQREHDMHKIILRLAFYIKNQEAMEEDAFNRFIKGFCNQYNEELSDESVREIINYLVASGAVQRELGKKVTMIYSNFC